MRRSARLIILAAIVIAIILALVGCAPGKAVDSPGYVSGDGTVTIYKDTGPAVDLTGTSFTGDPVDVADYRGQVVLINTWYASCPPCRAEAPELAALDSRDNVQVVGVNNRDDAGTAEAFDRTFDIRFPTIADTDGSAIAALQGIVAVNAVPSTVVLDTQGRLYARIIGRADPSTLESLVSDAAKVSAP